MSNQPRGHLPFTECEIKKVLKGLIDLSTYKNGTVSATQSHELLTLLNFKRDPTHVEATTKFYKSRSRGRICIRGIENVMRIYHKPHLFAGWYARNFDTDGSGTISGKEFKEAFELMAVVWPNVGKKSYDEFVKEADLDNSGDVTIEEFINWVMEQK